MFNKSISVAAVAILTFVAGCAGPSWHRDGVSPGNAATALSECKYQVGLNKIAGDKQNELIGHCTQGKGFRFS
jgi:hypothetical protein